jgi:hypothetical protein
LQDYSTIKAQNEQLKSELGQANSELAVFKNSESNVGVLKQRLAKYEAKLEEMVEERVNRKSDEMRQELDEKIKIYKDS